MHEIHFQILCICSDGGSEYEDILSDPANRVSSKGEYRRYPSHESESPHSPSHISIFS